VSKDWRDGSGGEALLTAVLVHRSLERSASIEAMLSTPLLPGRQVPEGSGTSGRVKTLNIPVLPQGETKSLLFFE